jgi:hypothetical protein
MLFESLFIAGGRHMAMMRNQFRSFLATFTKIHQLSVATVSGRGVSSEIV